MRFAEDTVVLGARTEKLIDEQWLLAMDAGVFGEDWGKEVRRLAQALEGRSIEFVVLPLFENSVLLGEDWSEQFLREGKMGSSPVLITTGRLLPPSELSTFVRQMIWIHPDATESLPGESLAGYGSNTRLLFPMMDLSGGQAAWKRFARQRNWKLAPSGALTDDLRPIWPECIMDILP